LDLAADALLADPRIDRPQEEKVRQRLRKQCDHLFVFLDLAEVHATNNLAERQLRPTVIARKLSAGNKTRAGADAWAILTSLGATARQQHSHSSTCSPAASLSPPAKQIPRRCRG
jgi:hypothetical protein